MYECYTKVDKRSDEEIGSDLLLFGSTANFEVEVLLNGDVKVDIDGQCRYLSSPLDSSANCMRLDLGSRSFP